MQINFHKNLLSYISLVDLAALLKVDLDLAAVGSVTVNNIIHGAINFLEAFIEIFKLVLKFEVSVCSCSFLLHGFLQAEIQGDSIFFF